MNLDQLTELFKWMLIINVGLLILTTISVILLRNFMIRLHTSLFGISKEQFAFAVYGYLGMYKIIVIVFNIVPYIALLLLR